MIVPYFEHNIQQEFPLVLLAYVLTTKRWYEHILKRLYMKEWLEVTKYHLYTTRRELTRCNHLLC